MLDTTNLVLFYDYVLLFFFVRSFIKKKKKKTRNVGKVEETRKNTRIKERRWRKNLFSIPFAKDSGTTSLIYRHTHARTPKFTCTRF